MSEPTSPSDAGIAAGSAAAGLTPQAIDAVLADFRRWLETLTAGCEPVPAADQPLNGQTPVDLHTLVGQFIALRHDVNLQTRAARNQLEQNSAALEHLGSAVALLQQQRDQPADRNNGEDSLRPLLKSLVDLYDALALALRESRRVQECILPMLDRLAADEPPSVPDRSVDRLAAALPFWARWLGLDRRLQAVFAAAAPPATALPPTGELRNLCTSVRTMLASLITGYSMSLERIDRVLQEHGLEPIPCVGQAFDPELMEVMEAVADTGRPAGEVVEEIRRGYRWQERLFRYALVRVARS